MGCRTILLMTAIACVLGCDAHERECFPTDYIGCACDDGRDGYAQCAADGSAYGECQWCGTTPGLGPAVGGAPGTGGAGGEGGEGGALLPFMSPCDADEQCETGLCFHYNAKGPLCSHACSTAADCEAPSPGCSGMGVCKAP